MRIAVIDGQGGGIGKHIVEKLRKALPDSVEVIALGTNSLATSQMLRAGANEGATGENAIRFNAARVNVIVGSIGIVIPNAMLGELTPGMAEAIASSEAEKVLLPLHRMNMHIIGMKNDPLPHLIEMAVARVKEIVS
ncbi:MAG: DUF3842 family protein [Clostridia bacterium]|nr:DUF3842 family protein [Clostridia bacterium]